MLNRMRLRVNVIPRRSFNFDTYKLVRQLERHGFTRGQSVALMRTINAFLVDSTLSLRQDLIATSDLENELYLSKAHIQEVRNVLTSLRQNDSTDLTVETQGIVREIAFLEDKFAEQILALKSDISLELNTQKAETKELTSEVDLRIQEIQHKLIIRLSDLKTNIETLKVELTTQIVWMTVITIASLMAVDWVLKGTKPVKKSEPKI